MSCKQTLNGEFQVSSTLFFQRLAETNLHNFEKPHLVSLMNERADLNSLTLSLIPRLKAALETEEQWSCKEQHEVCIALGTYVLSAGT